MIYYIIMRIEKYIKQMTTFLNKIKKKKALTVNDLPYYIKQHIQSFILIDKDMKSPTADIMKEKIKSVLPLGVSSFDSCNSSFPHFCFKSIYFKRFHLRQYFKLSKDDRLSIEFFEMKLDYFVKYVRDQIRIRLINDKINCLRIYGEDPFNTKYIFTN